MSSTVIQQKNSGFQGLEVYTGRGGIAGGLTMLTITNATVSRDEVWRAYRHTHDVRLRERYHCIGSVLDVEMN
jgi:hypothetical protein